MGSGQIDKKLWGSRPWRKNLNPLRSEVPRISNLYHGQVQHLTSWLRSSFWYLVSDSMCWATCRTPKPSSKSLMICCFNQSATLWYSWNNAPSPLTCTESLWMQKKKPTKHVKVTLYVLYQSRLNLEQQVMVSPNPVHCTVSSLLTNQTSTALNSLSTSAQTLQNSEYKLVPFRVTLDLTRKISRVTRTHQNTKSQDAT